MGKQFLSFYTGMRSTPDLYVQNSRTERSELFKVFEFFEVGQWDGANRGYVIEIESYFKLQAVLHRRNCHHLLPNWMPAWEPKRLCKYALKKVFIIKSISNIKNFYLLINIWRIISLINVRFIFKIHRLAKRAFKFGCLAKRPNFMLRNGPTCNAE